MAKTLEELDAFQLAHALKLEVYRLFRTHPEARRDFKLHSQLREAVRSGESNIAEGWRRFGIPEQLYFYNVSLGSFEEAKVRVQDGIDCEYFTERECEKAFELGRRAGAATKALMESLKKLPPKRKRK